MENEKRIIETDNKEFSIIVNALMNMRNSLKQENKETDLVDKVIRKTIKSQAKSKEGIFHKLKRNEAYESR